MVQKYEWEDPHIYLHVVHDPLRNAFVHFVPSLSATSAVSSTLDQILVCSERVFDL